MKKKEILLDSHEIEVALPKFMEEIRRTVPEARLRGWILMDDGVFNVCYDQGEGSGPSTFMGFCRECKAKIMFEHYAREARKERAAKKTKKKEV